MFASRLINKRICVDVFYNFLRRDCKYLILRCLIYGMFFAVRVYWSEVTRIITMKKCIFFIALLFASTAVNALIITLEISNTSIHKLENGTFQSVSYPLPDTYLIEYEIAEEVLFNSQYRSGIYFSEQVGESRVYDSYFQLLSKTAAPSSALFNAFVSDIYSYKSDADFVFDNNYRDIRLSYSANELYPQFENDADKQEFNNTVDSRISASTNEEQGWGDDINGRQIGQTYEWWTSFDLDALFSELPATQFGTYDDFLAAIERTMLNGVSFGYFEQLHVFDFERASGNTSMFIDYADVTEERGMFLDATARIVGFSGANTIQVSEPSTIVLMCISMLGVIRLRRKIS